MSAARYASNDGSFTLKMTFWERDESGKKCSHICLLMLNMYCGLRTLDTKNTSLYYYCNSACFMISGYLATKTKEVIYLKDPQLFDPTRPTRKNPY